MTAIISNQKSLIYTRNYENDLTPSDSSKIQRVALVAMPFLSLHRPFRLPISLIMGSFRVCTQGQPVHTAIAVTALAATVISFPIGMAITTAQDILIETKTFLALAKEGRKQEAMVSYIKIANSAFYLALLSAGGLQLSIVCLSIQVLTHLISSIDEFKKDRWLEASGQLLMAAVRLHQISPQYAQLKRKWEIENAVREIYVGELHGKWQFPSDHLPVGIEVDGVRIISWNVLNNAYMEWVTAKDSQGLNGSLISDLDHPVESNGLTQRDLVIVEMVKSMTSSGHVVALQECGTPFLEALQKALPSNWEMARSFQGTVKDQDVVLYDRSRLTYQPAQSEVTTNTYPSVPDRPLQNVYFTTEQGKNIRIINSHIPGDPTLPAREEFAQYVAKNHANSDAVTIALGDNNFDRTEMLDAYQKAGFTEFSLHSPWKTNIDPVTKNSKAIDHLFIAGGTHSRDLKPIEVLARGNLEETIKILSL